PDPEPKNSETSKPESSSEAKSNQTETPSDSEENKPEKSGQTEKSSPQKEEESNYPTEDDFKSFGVHFDDLPAFEPKPEDENKSATEAEDNSTSEKSTDQNQPDIFSQKSESESKPTESTEDLSTKEEQEAEKQQPPEPEQIQNKLNTQEKRSLNDQLKKGIKIGLNDRIAFTKHLFDGSVDDYNRVLSQLNTMSSYDEAKRFLDHQIKPDYNNWEDKETTEERFLEILQNKFD
ncbi:MAG: hypothetical protein ABR595_03690, partial [Psychroflexus sp.]